MSGKYPNESREMKLLTQEYVEKLTNIWETIFDYNSCKDNLRKLIEHARNFYKDLVEESLSRRVYIEKEIEELKNEAENLKRLLQMDVHLPCHDSENVPLLVIQSEMDQSLEELRERLRKRREEICELLLEQELLCEDLGETPRPLLVDPLPTAEEIVDFRAHLENLRIEQAERMNKLSTMRREIKNFMEILGLKIQSELETRLLNHRQVKLNKETFNSLQEMHHNYGSQVQQLKDSIVNMRQKLAVLWDRLNVSPSTRHKFKSYESYNERTYMKLYEELKRCELLKSQNVKKYVQQIRDEIREWWDKTLKSNIERNRFSSFNSTCFTDDLLVMHEMELEDLKLCYETNHQIFELYAERNILWDRMNALEAKASEPGRYNNRGGQLLKEEKERKTIATKLPKIEKQICDLASEYEEREHAPFLVYGENIIDVISAQWEKKRKDKEVLSSARRNASRTPVSKTTPIIRTPMALKNANSMLSLGRTPSAVNSSNAVNVCGQKRKLNPSDKATPLAKRSLFHAFNNQNTFIKPCENRNVTVSNNTRAAFKPPMKKSRVIATTIRRKSGVHNTNIKKRKSITKNAENSRMPSMPSKNRIQNTDEDKEYITYEDVETNDTYTSFQNCIEPGSQSSIIQNASIPSSTNRCKPLRQLIKDDKTRHARKQNSRVITCTPSKQNLKHHSSLMNLVRTPNAKGSQYSIITYSTGRKLTTKNLPIII